MFPVFQTLHILPRRRAKFPASSQGQNPKWLGPGSLAVEPATRVVTCEKEQGGAAIEERGKTQGTWCRAERAAISDQPSGSEAEAEAEREEKNATAQLSGSTAFAKIRPARQGMPAKLWSQVLHAVQPSKVVVAGTVACQAGLHSFVVK